MKKTDSGYIRLFRKIEQWPLYFAEPFSKTHAWIDMILLANHSPKNIIVRGNIIELKRGQIGWSEESLARRWFWSRNRVRRFLKWLKSAQQVEQQKSAVLGVITILNYNEYQTNGTAHDTTDGQQTIQQTIQQTDTNKKEKNEIKNEKKESARAKFLDFVTMSTIEHGKLVKKLGKEKTEQYIERLNGYIGQIGPVKAARYHSHYHTILNWDRRDNPRKARDRKSGESKVDWEIRLLTNPTI